MLFSLLISDIIYSVLFIGGICEFDSKELRRVSKAGAIYHKCRWFKQLRNLSEEWDMSFNGEEGESRCQSAPGADLRRGWISQALFPAAEWKEDAGHLWVLSQPSALTDIPASRGWFLIGAGGYVKSRKINFAASGKSLCGSEPHSLAGIAAAPRGSRRSVFWDGLYLALPIATAPCTLIPSHKAAATLVLYSTSIGKVGSQDIALSHGYFSVFASV